MPISTMDEAGTEWPSADVDEVIIKAVMVDGVTIILQNENADYWLLPGAVEEMVYTFMTTGFKSLQVHPAFKRQVRTIASWQFKAAYGDRYMEREDCAVFSVWTRSRMTNCRLLHLLQQAPYLISCEENSARRAAAVRGR